MPQLIRKQRRLIFVVTSLVFVLSALLSISLVLYLAEQGQLQKQRQVAANASDFAYALQQEFSRELSAANALAAFVRQQDGDTSQFDKFAQHLFPYYENVTALSLAPQGTITAVYPLNSNQGLLGHQIMTDATQAADAIASLVRNTVSVTGPYQLKQGGEGIIGRLAVYLDPALQDWWGLVNVTLRLADLNSLERLENMQQQGLLYRLTRLNARDNEPELIRQSDPGIFNQPIVQLINLGDAQWQLQLVPIKGWGDNVTFYRQLALAILFSVMLAALVAQLIQTRIHKHQLEALVNKRTAALHTELQRQKSFISASNAGSWEFKHLTNQLYGTPEYYALLGYDKAEFANNQPDNLHACWTALLHPADKAQACATFQQYLQFSEPDSIYENTFRMRHADGSWRWILSRGKTLLDENGQKTALSMGIHLDITARKEAELKLQLLARMFEQSSEGVLITNAEQQIVMVNEAFTKISGYSADEVLGKNPKMLASGRQDKAFYSNMWLTIAKQGNWQGEIWNRRKDGRTYPEWLSISQIIDDNDQVSHYVALFSDISQYKEDEAQIKFLANYDPLTQLPNRSLLIDRTEQALLHAERNSQPLAMLLMDLDRFKQINESLGHEIGDELLIQVAQRLRKLCRAEDTLCRLGGDEFVLVLPDADANGAAHLAERMLPLILQPYYLAEQELTLSMSVGIAMYPEDGQQFHQLYKHADIAMYKAKESGRNRYSFFTADMQQFHTRNLLLENALRRAIERDQLSLVYQPQYSMVNNQLIGFEALLRWYHDDFGQVSPAEFIPLAERNGLIVAIGEWVIVTALQQLAEWHRAGYRQLNMAINLSSIQFRQENLLQFVTNAIEFSGVPAAKVELEITESAMAEQPERAIALIAELKAKGLNIAIDDFGTGYSSLSYLKRFALTKLKIDQSFVRDLLTDSQDKAIVNAIINMASNLGLKTIAEGVETAAQRDLLKHLGCDEMQGYYYSKPLLADQASQFIQQAL
ncbi:PAS domain S-box-containing protein/diguanylate cyclase (GGDEF) domain-containing protein [Arsukibacterium tuosuense]|uniref:cyclic-guanylate-specific phosphodiesterase n=1 Tax=Arsukibacterium tuosuense TaxID=1323745 RepID=A0A285J5U9_9GAMM|nr:EAL domain-containing protein [Arsukibacterium tuosuense]SNY55710.1 PAS domain S-box-containing protein/diguanylate cyclase (GGDEF) domain-containing protein [Arsukibacterium tuosuense]